MIQQRNIAIVHYFIHRYLWNLWAVLVCLSDKRHQYCCGDRWTVWRCHGYFDHRYLQHLRAVLGLQAG